MRVKHIFPKPNLAHPDRSLHRQIATFWMNLIRLGSRLVICGSGMGMYQFQPNVGKYSTHGLGGGAFKYFGNFHPYLPGDSWSNLTAAHIFQMGWSRIFETRFLESQMPVQCIVKLSKFPTVKGRFLGDFRNEKKLGSKWFFEDFCLELWLECLVNMTIGSLFCFQSDLKVSQLGEIMGEPYHLAHFLGENLKIQKLSFPFKRITKKQVCFFGKGTSNQQKKNIHWVYSLGCVPPPPRMQSLVSSAPRIIYTTFLFSDRGSQPVQPSLATGGTTQCYSSWSWVPHQDGSNDIFRIGNPNLNLYLPLASWEGG